MNRSILPTPTEMIAHLDRFVRGQVRAKRDLSVAIYNHYLSQAERDLSGTALGSQHILLMGPTGVGKTYLVKTLADFLGVPVGFTSATSLVETGYKGSSVESVIKALLGKAGGNPKQAERGIVFIDEVDKIRSGETGGRDVSGEGVQNALLTLLDGRVSAGEESSRHAAVDTSRILFICTGAFVDLEPIVAKRLGTSQSRMGFHPRPEEELADVPEGAQYQTLCQTETADLVTFGMIPEFVGRFATISVLHGLSQSDLRVIIGKATERSPIQSQQKLAAWHGIDLEFTEAALDAIATEAAALKTGARGLHRLVGQSVDAVDYRWPELAADGVGQVIIDADCLLEDAEPQLIKNHQVVGRKDLELRKKAIAGLPMRPKPVMDEGNSASQAVHTEEAARNRIETLKAESMKYESLSESAKIWWDDFEQSNAERPFLILRVLEELERRKSTIEAFFLAYAYSNTDNIQANLHYLDYMILKKRE